MIQSKTNQIMLGGINKYAKIYETKNSNVQIRVTDGEGKSVNYEMCLNWQPKESVTFKDILNKKIDILGYEQLSTPYLKKSLEYYKEMYSDNNDDLSIFLFEHNGKIAIAVFNGFKNLKTVTLSKHFELIGL